MKMQYAFKLLEDAFFQTIKFLIDNIIMQNTNLKDIAETLKQKLFILNYKNHNLGVSLFSNSLNEISEMVDIQIEFSEDVIN